MPIEPLKPGHFFDKERMATLKAMAPEAFVDGKINWSTLKDALGGELEESEEESEHFGLNWPGKREARRLAGKPSTGTLLPAKGEGRDEDSTGNIYIEGENLEVLKLLRKSYTGRVKMIYIDPPYNTGNDFVYDDDFSEPLQDYLRRTGQIDGDGKATTTNKKADGRFHSKWLSMMYPRLRLARELLRDDGVIFVSIDDNEVHHLRMLMNEVFGEECFIAEFIWKRRQNVDSRSKNGASVDHEYVIVFSKSSESKIRGGEKDLDKYSNPDNDLKGPWMSDNMTGLATKDQRPNLHYDLIHPITKVNYGCPTTGWRYEPKRMAVLIGKNEVIFPKEVTGRPRRKKFLADLESEFTGKSTIIESVFNTQATRELRELFDEKDYFDFPKPSDFVKEILSQATQTEDSGPEIILDFFSGSATTAHAVLDLNKQDGGNRQFILVQMPEKTPDDSEAAKAGYKTIAEIGKERIRRVIDKIKAEKQGELGGRETIDLGFKVYKLAKSNFKQWQNYYGESIEKIDELFAEHADTLVPTWREVENGLLTEILLMEGYPLQSKVIPLPEYQENTVYLVQSEFHTNRLIVCLDDKLDQVTIDTLVLSENDAFVCLDSAIDNQFKSRLADKGQVKTI